MPLDGLRSLAAFASSMASAYKAGSIPALNLVQELSERRLGVL